MTGRRMSMRLLGGFDVELDGLAIPAERWRRRRAAALVKVLALSPEYRLVRDEVIDALWPELGSAAGGANLRKAAHHARRTLGDPEAVVLDGTTASLLPGGQIVTDVARFEAAARQALDRRDPQRCRQAAELYGGELLPDDRYEPWCEGSRRRLAALYRELLVGGQQWGRLLAVDPVSEIAHRGVIRERLEAGDRAGAIRQFDRMRAALREELGVSPDPESVALYQQVLAFEGRDVPSPAERARALLAWGAVHWERADLEEAERTAMEVRSLAVDAGLGRELAEASELLGLVAYARGSWREVFAQGFLDATRRTPELAPFVYDANMCMSEFALHEHDGLDPIAAFATELLDAADEPGTEQARALGLLLRGEVGLFASRDPHEVRADLSAAVRLHEATSSTSGAVLATERLAQLETVVGHTEKGERLHRHALEQAAATAITDHLLPLVFGGMLDNCELPTAVAVLDEAEVALAAIRPCQPCSMSFHVGACIVSARDGQPDRAHRHLDAAARIAAMWEGGPWHAAVAEARAVLRQAEDAGRDEVRALLATAAEVFATAGRPRDAARCEAELGRIS